MHIGREQGDDPTKFYLLDPYIITTGSPAPKGMLTSTTVVGGSGTSDMGGGGVGGKGNAKRHAGNMQKAVSSNSLAVSESHVNGKSHYQLRSTEHLLYILIRGVWPHFKVSFFPSSPFPNLPSLSSHPLIPSQATPLPNQPRQTKRTQSTKTRAVSSPVPSKNSPLPSSSVSTTQCTPTPPSP